MLGNQLFLSEYSEIQFWDQSFFFWNIYCISVFVIPSCKLYKAAIQKHNFINPSPPNKDQHSGYNFIIDFIYPLIEPINPVPLSFNLPQSPKFSPKEIIFMNIPIITVSTSYFRINIHNRITPNLSLNKC